MEEKNNYIFKNAFVFVESGNLKSDLYRAMKDEIGYMLEKKYDQYFKTICEDSSKNNEYYKDLVDLLSKLKGVMLDSEITSIKEYFEDYKFQVKVGIYKPEDEKKMFYAFDALRKFDDTITNFAYEIMEKAHNLNFEKKYGVFHIIKQYFNMKDGKKYNSFQEFLDYIYSLVFETLKLKYGDKEYGKKE